MPYVCDGLSVGVLIFDDHDRLLMITRAKPPAGIAPVAGHVRDNNPEFTHLDAAVAETKEEVGLDVSPEDLRRVYIQYRPNQCGAHVPHESGGHQWQVYLATQWAGDITLAEDEAAAARWYTPDEVQDLAARTVAYSMGLIPEEEWQAKPGLEPVWVDILGLLPKPYKKDAGVFDTVVQVGAQGLLGAQKLYGAPVKDASRPEGWNTVEYNGNRTEFRKERFAGDFAYVDPHGRRAVFNCEELTVAEETCTGEQVTAHVELPDPGSEAALEVARAVLVAMGLGEDYELVKRQP